MEEIKARLSNIIQRIEKVFPGNPDLMGFLGVSRDIITEALAISRNQLNLISNDPVQFDIITLKRELAESFDKIDRLLPNAFEDLKDKEFNSLLKALSKSRQLIQERAFAVTNSESLLTETEIAVAKQELKMLQESIQAIKASAKEANDAHALATKEIADSKESVKTAGNAALVEISSTSEEIKKSRVTVESEIEAFRTNAKNAESQSSQILSDLNTKINSINETETKYLTSLKNIEADEAKIKTINQNVATWRGEIQSVKAEIDRNSKEYSELNAKAKAVQTEIETTYTKISGTRDASGNLLQKGFLQDIEDLKSQASKFLKDQEAKYATQFDEIVGLLPGATSAGLAEAYQRQKNSYARPMLLWSWIFILTMLSMTGFSVYLLFGPLQPGQQPSLNDAAIALLRELPFFIPTIWLAGYASKQQSQYKRLQQEYAFKETNARSFHGHKVQIEELLKRDETDAELLSQLVAQLVVITSQNPSVTLDNKSHEDNSPVFKFLEKYLPSARRNIGSDVNA